MSVETDEPVTYSVQTEWARPFNDLGKFSGTFTTAAIDVAIERPVGPLTLGEAYWVDVRLRNRSLESRTITELVVETPADTQKLTPNVELDPGEIERIPTEGGGFVPEEGADETRLQVTAVAADGNTFTQTNRIEHSGADTSDSTDPVSEDRERNESSRRPKTTETPGSTDSSAGDRMSQDGETETTASSGSAGPGFGVFTALAAGGGMLASRLWSDTDEK